MLPFSLFQGPEHQSYHLPGGKPAALLVHGFPGTPAELRPLGEVFQQAGWTVRGLLLPGFGAEFKSLGQRNAEEWFLAVDQVLAKMQAEHFPVVLVGYSMGGGISLYVASRRPPDGLILLAPFSGLKGGLWAIMPIIKFVLPTIRPFKVFKVNFSSPETRKGLATLLPGSDLDDPQVQEAVRDFGFPLRILDEVRKVGENALRATSKINIPTLILQGSQDDLVRPNSTRKLLQRFSTRIRYIELNAAHDLVNPEKSAWPLLVSEVQIFLGILEQANDRPGKGSTFPG